MLSLCAAADLTQQLEITKCLEEEDADALINQFPVPADYDGVGSKGTKFVFYM